MMRLESRSPWPAAALVCLALGGVAARAETPQQVLRQATEMLASGLSSEFVAAWLEGSRVPPARPTAEQAIALRDAGASDELMMWILELATEEIEAAEAVQPAPVPIEWVGPAEEGEGVLVSFELSYAPRFEEGEPTWDLYVYLDGRPLSFVPVTAGTVLAEIAEPLTFQRRMAPGPHTLRVAQERHGRRGIDAWRHQARVAPEAFTFELQAGVDAAITVDFAQGLEALLGGRGPLSFGLLQAERAEELADVGGDPERWGEICEDLESETREWGEKRRNRRLEGCVSWASLWASPAPAREAVWEALAVFDFRPVPKSSQG